MKAAIAFGRMNPTTTGHFLVVKALHDTDADKKYIYLSHSQDKKKNPLPYETKVDYLRIFLKHGPYPDVEVKESEAKTAIGALCELYEKGFTDIIYICGSDRVEEFREMLGKYNGKPTKAGVIPYEFNSLEIVSAGERDPDAEDVSGMSASKMRALATEGNLEEFIKGVPTDARDLAVSYYNDVREGLGLE